SRAMAEGAAGPPSPTVYTWMPPRRQAAPRAAAEALSAPKPDGAFAALAGLIR
ncbi:MAG: hypothetical protein RLZZ136_713, partial [Pseudomonadota bacterium]